MGLFSKKEAKFFSKQQEKAIVSAIKTAEKNTSGEIRVHLDNESVDNIEERAIFIFKSLGMSNTELSNGVLIYVNPVDKQFLVMGDEGIHKHVGQQYWETLSAAMKAQFTADNYTDGIVEAILNIGQELKKHFPFDNKTDLNELDDEISYEV